MVTVIKKGTIIREVKKKVDTIVFKSSGKSIAEFAGKLKTKIDPLIYQKQMRDEWK